MPVSQEEKQRIQGAMRQDPRPDLAEDSEWWVLLLNTVKDSNLRGVLHGFRCMGTRLRMERGSLVLRPEYDPTGRRAWKDPAEYDADKARWLVPHKDLLVQTLVATKEEIGRRNSRGGQGVDYRGRKQAAHNSLPGQAAAIKDGGHVPGKKSNIHPNQADRVEKARQEALFGD